MTTADTHPLGESVEALKESATAALENSSADDLERFEKRLSEFEAACREIQQSLWAEEATAVIRRLEADEPLTDADRNVIRTFLVSDAEHYLRVENNFQDWIAELYRLLDDMAARARGISRDSVAELRGVVKDAIRLVPDIRNYLEERSRVERCTIALDQMDNASRDLLVRVLKRALVDPSD